MAGDVSRENGRKNVDQGRPKLYASKLREAIIKEAEARAAPLAKVLMDKAMQGDVPAIREMMDRALGKAIQGVDVTSGGQALPTPILASVKILSVEKSNDEEHEHLQLPPQ